MRWASEDAKISIGGERQGGREEHFKRREIFSCQGKARAYWGMVGLPGELVVGSLGARGDYETGNRY